MKRSSIKVCKTFVFVAFLSIMIYQPVGAQSIIPASERSALEALYNATDGAHWNNHTNWMSSASEDSWFGISLNSDNTVRSISLPYNNLTGNIPPALSNLTSLNILILSGNSLTGSIPDEICSLVKLMQLQLAENKLTGGLPANIGQLKALNTLDLSSNQLIDIVPSNIGLLENLTQLKLSYNQFYGTIPSTIGDLINLRILEIQDNQLIGSIPTEIGELKNLNNLNLINNLLSGTLPKEIFRLVNLSGLYLMNNNFEGALSDSIGKLTNLLNLNLEGCGFEGSLPSEIGQLTKLKNLNLRKNSFSGSIPDAFSGFSSLVDVKIDSNLIDYIPPLTNISSKFLCNNNRLDFTDLEPNDTLISSLSAGNFKYAPQAEFGSEHWVTAIEGNPYNLTIPCGGTKNHYTWYKEGIKMTTAADSPTLHFNNITYSDTGTYHITVTNELLPDLTLTSLPVHLSVMDHCLKNDSLALVALYHATDGADWYNNENWLQAGTRVKDWYGIDADSCDVLSIDLYGNNLTGTLPSEIGNLVQLDTLILTNNNLTGSIPSEISELENLSVFHLDDNNLTGSIPDGVWNLTNLKELLLNLNPLDPASIPESISNLYQLKVLGMAEINLTGAIPSQVYTLSHLLNLALYGNELTGSISSDIGNLTGLKYLYLNSNQLTGAIPPETGTLSYLEELRLDDNQLSETIPAGLGNLKNLNYLNLSENKLTGKVPTEMAQMTKVKECRIDHNELTGAIPTDFNSLSSLEIFSFEHNLIEDMQELPNIDTLLYCEMNHLTFEDFERNLILLDKPGLEYDYSPQLHFGREYDTLATEDYHFELSIPCGGKYNHYLWFKDSIAIPDIPDSSTLTFESFQADDIGTYYVTVTNDSVPNLTLESEPVHIYMRPHCIKQDSLALVTFYFATNGPQWLHNDQWLTGPVSSWYGIESDSCNVLEINLGHDSLVGSLPSEIGVFTALRQLVLNHNYLIDEIPHEIGNLLQLVNLNLQENMLSGNIPDELFKLVKLQTLNLGNNQLEGTINDSVKYLTMLNYLLINDNQLTGDIPDGTGDLENLLQLDLSSNEIDGDIPSSVDGLKKIQVINLGNNQLNGDLPKELWELTTLNRLLLQNNEFEGEIPTSAGDLTNLQIFRIDSNYFSGSIPASIGQLEKLDTLRFNENQLNEIPELVNIDSVLVCSYNYLTFEDFELNLGLFDKESLEYTYSPQYKFGREYDTIAYYKYPFTLAIPCGGAHNHYQWFKNDTLQTSLPDSYLLTLSRVRYSDAGIYYVKVTNDLIPNLELTSQPVTVTVERGLPMDLSFINLVIIDGSHEPNFIIENIDDYPDNRLVVLNKWGKLVYDIKGYNNELDFTSYPEGTYYYLLTYTPASGKTQIKNFVDVIKK